MTRRLLTVAVLAVLLSAGAPAAADPLLGKRTQDLSFNFSPDFTGVTGDALTLDAGYGRFVRDRLEVRLNLLYETIEDVAPGEKDYRAREITVGGEYNFSFGARFVPFVGFDLGYRQLNYLDISDSATVYGPRGGLKLFLADNVALDFSVAYKLASAQVYVNDFKVEDNDLQYGLGFRVMF